MNKTEAKELTHDLVREAMEAAYEQAQKEESGKNADYIPYLAGVDPSLFAITICLPNGEVFGIGDSGYKFGIESISKVSTALLAMNQHGANEILDKIGADATGLPFNSIMAMLLERDHPSTPLVNAGAISACSMISPMGDSDAKWEAILGFMEQLTSSKLEVIDELYDSESATNFNNKSIAWLLRNYDRIYDDPDIALDLYTRQCSVGISTQQLAVMAGTIAHNGVNPLNKENVFMPNLTPHIVSMMATVGFYERTGDWMFTTGMPAKSGVGGGVMGVIPGVMGIAAFSPRLDKSGNSVKAQKALSYISNRLNLNVYSPFRCTIHHHEYVYV
ncbi:MAG: glutaminase A [Rikenellaceae bacterium]